MPNVDQTRKQHLEEVITVWLSKLNSNHPSDQYFKKTLDHIQSILKTADAGDTVMFLAALTYLSHVTIQIPTHSPTVTTPVMRANLKKFLESRHIPVYRTPQLIFNPQDEEQPVLNETALTVVQSKNIIELYKQLFKLAIKWDYQHPLEGNPPQAMNDYIGVWQSNMMNMNEERYYNDYKRDFRIDGEFVPPVASNQINTHEERIDNRLNQLIDQATAYNQQDHQALFSWLVSKRGSQRNRDFLDEMIHDERFFGGKYQLVNSTSPYTNWRVKDGLLCLDMVVNYHSFIRADDGLFLYRLNDSEELINNDVERAADKESKELRPLLCAKVTITLHMQNVDNNRRIIPMVTYLEFENYSKTLKEPTKELEAVPRPRSP